MVRQDADVAQRVADDKCRRPKFKFHWEAIRNLGRSMP
jgi:hypothetical protein